MSLWKPRPSAGPAPLLRSGVARVDRRTKDLIPRLAPGEIAVIDHADLDRVAAEGLVERRPAAVINAAPSTTGRYPNVGPLLIVQAGIALVDEAGAHVMDRIAEGDLVTVADGEVLVDGRRVGGGTMVGLADAQAALEAARRTLGDELVRFAANTLEYVQQEHHLVTDAPDVPATDVDLADRHVLVVVRGHDYRDDLLALRRGGYLSDMTPVKIGVDGGADALLEIDERPDIIIGDFDSVSEAAIRCGAQLIVHGYPDGSAPGAGRLDALGVPYTVFEAVGTSEDIALLLAHERGADLIVAVGTHSSMTDFLDKGRGGMASTFLVRLRVGPRLVDAKGVSRLYRSRVRPRDMVLLLASATFTLAIVTATSDLGRLFVRSLWLWIRSVVGA